VGAFTFFTTIREASGVEDQEDPDVVIRSVQDGLVVTSMDNNGYAVRVMDILGRELGQTRLSGQAQSFLPVSNGVRLVFVVLTNTRTNTTLHRTVFVP
jgi:hypothetical protein